MHSFLYPFPNGDQAKSTQTGIYPCWQNHWNNREGLLDVIYLCASVLVVGLIKYGHIAPDRGYAAGSSANSSHLIQSSFRVAAEPLQQLC